MSDLSIKEVIALMEELKAELREQYRKHKEQYPDSKQAEPVPSIQFYADGSIRLKRRDDQYICPTIHPYSDKILLDTFDMVLSRGRELIIDEGVSLGEKLTLGVNCRYVDS